MTRHEADMAYVKCASELAARRLQVKWLRKQGRLMAGCIQHVLDCDMADKDWDADRLQTVLAEWRKEME